MSSSSDSSLAKTWSSDPNFLMSAGAIAIAIGTAVFNHQTKAPQTIIDEQEKRIAALEKKNEDQTRMIMALHQQIQSTNGRLEDMETSIDDTNTRVSKVSNSTKRTTEYIDDLRRENEGIKSVLKDTGANVSTIPAIPKSRTVMPTYEEDEDDDRQDLNSLLNRRRRR